MTGENSGRCYPAVIKTLHWLIAVLVFVVLPLGFLQKLVKEDVYDVVNIWHISLGFTVFLLMLGRVAARFLVRRRIPPRAADMPRWESRLAAWVQGLLYAALLIEPVLGWLTTNAQGFPLVWFDLIPIWSPFGKSPAADLLLDIHLTVAWVIIALIGLHVAGALYRRIICRDDTLSSMT